MRILLTLSFLITSCSLFGQTKSYATVKIANWTLEQFPKHFLTKAAKVYTEKNKLTGKLTYYQELNEYGKPEGLTVTIQKADYTSPASAYYYRKGVLVYRAEFFARSSKANTIVNRNMDEIEDGPQLKREFLANDELQEIVDVYENGELVKTNRPDNSPKSNWTESGLLDGKFKFENDYAYTIYEGIAKDGEILFLKDIYMRTDIIETKIIGDTIYRKGTGGREKGKSEKLRINSRLKITNDETKKDMPGFFYCEYLTDIPKVLRQMQLFNLPQYNDVIFYSDSLLNGEFDYRKTNGTSFEIYTGTANNGYFKSLKIASFEFDDQTGNTTPGPITEYTFTTDSVFVFETTNESLRKKAAEYKIYRNIRITNSENIASKGEDYYFLDEISKQKIYQMQYAK